MTVYVIIHTTVDDTETHHREIVPKIMRAVERHGGKRIGLGHGEQLRVHVGEPPNANRLPRQNSSRSSSDYFTVHEMSSPIAYNSCWSYAPFRLFSLALAQFGASGGA
jgi:hypothetical protein